MSSPDSPTSTQTQIFTKKSLSSARTMQQIIKSHLKNLQKSSDSARVYKCRFIVTSLSPQIKVRMVDNYYLGTEEEWRDEQKRIGKKNSSSDENLTFDDLYAALSLSERRFARRVVNEEILIEQALTDDAADMADEVALGDTVQLVFQIKDLKQYTQQKDLAEDQFPSELGIVDLKVEKRTSTLRLAYQTIFDPLSYFTIVLGFSLFVMFSGWYHKGFMWRWGLGGLLISVGLGYWLLVQWREFMDSYRAVRRGVGVHKDSKFFEDKKGQ